MAEYAAPVEDMKFALRHLAGYDEIAQLPGYEDASWDLVEAVVEEASKVAGRVLSPLNKTGDQQGSKLIDHKVKTPDGWKAAFDEVAEGGWIGLACDPEYGGQGLPVTVGAAVSEMWEAANMSFALCNLLTQGAIDALELNGSDALKETYIPPMIEGRWTGTMNLTEPQAGSDLAAVRSKAEPEGDHYRVSGQKIFITYGDHDLTENIVHLVLARIPDAPAGVKGLSLFVVPKFLVNEDGSLGEANDVHCVALEHKLGIHASPTAVLSFGDHGGSIGYLIGEANRGLEYMFVMMNRARYEMALQGLGLAEMAYQCARDYARDRVQGKVLAREAGTAIIGHPDVRRSLMDMKSRIEAMRALTYFAGGAMDRAHRAEDAAEKAAIQSRIEFLTPVVKGWCTETGQILASIGIQVHGGMGFVEETGAAQYYRDARIMTIYEGTTAIQSNALVFRSTLRDQGAVAKGFVKEIKDLVDSITDDALAGVKAGLTAATAAFEAAVDWLVANANRPECCAAGGVNYLLLAGTVLGGYQMARAALAARAELAAGDGNEDFLTAKVATADFYARHVLPEAAMLAQRVTEGAESVFGLHDDQF